MSKDHMPVVAAIPNYNMGSSLHELLPQVLDQGYDAVFVLDDASTDNSRAVVERFDDQVRFVGGTENVGSGANRNRVIPVLQELGITAIIHFIDADMRLESDHIPSIAREIVANKQIGFVTGLVKERSGRQNPWNYGPRQCLRTDLTVSLQTIICAISTRYPKDAIRLRSLSRNLLTDWPDPLARPVSRQIFWGVESNMLIRSDIFAEFSGFDPNLRDHEIQDLAIRMHDCGLERWFDPRIVALHTAVQVRSGSRNFQMAKTEWQIAKKHGLMSWLLPNGNFHPEL